MKHIITLVLALLSPLALAANTAVLTWTEPAASPDGAYAYNVYQGIKGQAKTRVQTAVPGTTTTISTGLLLGREYCWQLRTVIVGFESVESVDSTEACKTFPGAAPSALTVK